GGPNSTPGHTWWAAYDSPTPNDPKDTTAIGKARSSVTTMAARTLDIMELMASPNATLSRAIKNRKRKATTTSVAVTPPNRKGSAPTGASMTMYMPTAV